MRSDEYQVYVIANADGRRYIGLSDDVARRVEQHNDGTSTWTRHRGPWALEWTSRPLSLTDARKLENLLKRQKGGLGLDRIMATHSSSGS